MKAKTELLKIVDETGSSIRCALLKDVRSYEKEEQVEFALPVDYTPGQLEEFYKALDYNYNSWYGGQELEGIVWLSDGTWLERGEYDGAEWWEHKVLPEIPDTLIPKGVVK